MNDCIQQLEATGDYKVIKRLVPKAAYWDDTGSQKKIGIFLDTETTGLDASTDKVIELAMVPFEFDAAGRIYRVLPEYNALNDPGFPIPEIATQITGITDDMVKGKSIDTNAVKQLLSEVSIVIAHNAQFDRPFCENLMDEFKDISWACSIADVNWQEEGIEGVKLEYLAYKFGFFFEGHRATIDCQAGIELLASVLPDSGALVLKRLLENARRTDVRLWAEGSPFDKKDELRKRGYRWSAGDNGQRKCWYRDLPAGHIDDEMQYLNTHIYSRKVAELPMDTFTALQRYSKRI